MSVRQLKPVTPGSRFASRSNFDDINDINFALTYAYGNTINCVYSDYIADDLIFRIRLKNIMNNSKKKPNQVHSLDQSDEIYVLKNFQDELLNNLISFGIRFFFFLLNL